MTRAGRVWLLLLLGRNSSTDRAPVAPPRPSSPSTPAPAPPPPLPALGTDVAVVNDKDVQLFSAASLPDATPTTVSLTSRIAGATWGSDHRLYARARREGLPVEPLPHRAVVIDGTTVREIAIPPAKPSKDRGVALESGIHANADGSVWFFECWGPKYHPKSAMCATYHRVRLDAEGEDYSFGELAAARPLPQVAPPAGWSAAIRPEGDAAITCAGASAVRGQYQRVRDVVWLQHEPPLYAVRINHDFTLYRGCAADDEGKWTDVVPGASGYYAFRDETWKLARDGKVVRDLGLAWQVVFGR